MTLTYLFSFKDAKCVVNSAITGYKVDILRPSDTTKASSFNMADDVRHIIFTAETHNFPTGGFSKHVLFLTCIKAFI